MSRGEGEKNSDKKRGVLAGSLVRCELRESLSYRFTMGYLISDTRFGR